MMRSHRRHSAAAAKLTQRLLERVEDTSRRDDHRRLVAAALERHIEFRVRFLAHGRRVEQAKPGPGSVENQVRMRAGRVLERRSRRAGRGTGPMDLDTGHWSMTIVQSLAVQFQREARRAGVQFAGRHTELLIGNLTGAEVVVAYL